MFRHFTFFLLVISFLSGCGPEVIDDVSDTSYQLVNQDSSSVIFPDDFEGQTVVMGYIYTNCPDICSIITANMNNVYRQLDDKENVHFVGLTFDPERDTPSKLKSYMESFDLDEEHFTYLTGDTATVDSLMRRLKIMAIKSDTTASGGRADSYLLNHTDQMNLMDAKGRIVQEYGGSQVPPEHVLEDIESLQ